MSNPRIRVMCVDDHHVVCEGIAQIVGQQVDMEVVAIAMTGQEAVDLYQTQCPDVTLMDLQLGSMSGLETIREIRRRDGDAHIVVLTTYDGQEDIFRALEAGAATYLLKDTVPDDLVRIIRDVHCGQHPLPEVIQKRLSERAGGAPLTQRETQVVELMASGFRNKEVAVVLGIAEDTVEAHARNIYTKLDVQDRTAAVTVALQRGIIHLK